MTQVMESFAPLAFDSIRIGLCSPDKILKASHGEVKKPETINYRTFKPEPDGLFCERIFGPTKDWECHCGKYKKIRYKGIICDKCGVEVTRSAVRRSRIGHIKLTAPVSHIWYLKGIPSRMGLLLDMTQKSLEDVVYFAKYVVLDPGNTGLEYKQVLSVKELRQAKEEYGYDSFRVGMGAEAVKELLERVNVDEEVKSLRDEIINATGQKKIKLVKRLEVAEKFQQSGNKPEWMIITVLPIMPPDLRPMVQLDGGRFASSDLNELYRRIINRNNRLQSLIERGAPEVIINNEKRMLQESVDTLIDNGRRGRAISGAGNRPLKSLSDMLKGKQGRFRQNLLGKRVDYSGRSVIVVGPELKIYQCGLPKEMAIELFKPFIMRELMRLEKVRNVKAAKKMVERQEGEVWDILDQVIKEHPVMLNRAPTLHRLGIQAFEPILVEGKAIKLHPLVCTAFNADFDGDQMAVHVPLSAEAQAECRFLLLSTNNLLKPSDGGVVAVPSQDMVLGIYYLTQFREDEGTHKDEKGNIIPRAFKSINEAILAYENKVITLHEKIKVKVPDYQVRDNASLAGTKGHEEEGIIETTVGRIIFNENIPQDLGGVDRTKKENKFALEIDKLVKKKDLKTMLENVMEVHGATVTAEVLDRIKALGYKYSTKAAMTVSIADITVPEEKKDMIKKAEAQVESISKNFRRGLITEEERYKEVINTWQRVDEDLEKKLMSSLDKYNNIYMMADSGARGSNKQIKQLAGMRGLMGSTTGKTIELPIKSNFREGLDVLEYFISAHGARKGLTDTALRTADSGYLTRRLVDISHDITIRELDCCHEGDEIPYMEIKAFVDGEEVIESLRERITGRYIVEDVINEETGEIIAKKDTLVLPTMAKKIMAELDRRSDKKKEDKITRLKNQSMKIRTVLTCKAKGGACAKCYGMNLASRDTVGIGESVGVIAAQSIGEPGTQLTMRTFHTGGVAGGDITQGLPRVEELFEARKPKGRAIVSQISGVVRIEDDKKKRTIFVTDKENGDEKEYPIPYGSRIKVEEGQLVKAGDALTEGSIDPHDILEIKGVRDVQDYLLKEVQRVYRLQGVEINDKHIEMIVRQMLRKVKITNEGESDLLPGTTIDIRELDDINKKLRQEGKKEVEYEQILLGITKASLATDSFLSAASFQETTKVLTEASITGKVDRLQGLKENVIIGRLIQSGTGMKKYQDIEISTDNEDTENIDEEDTFDYDKDELNYEGREFNEEDDGSKKEEKQEEDLDS